MRSAPVLERAVTLSGNRISAETLGQRLEVEAAKDADLLTIRVLDSTAAVLVWWLTRRQGPTSRSSASEPGPEMPSPA